MDETFGAPGTGRIRDRRTSVLDATDTYTPHVIPITTSSMLGPQTFRGRLSRRGKGFHSLLLDSFLGLLLPLTSSVVRLHFGLRFPVIS